MGNTVFILGAGASKAAGAPLMRDFLDTAYDLWKLGRVANFEVPFTTVFEARSALQQVHSKSQLDLDNIESVFSTIEMAKTIGRFPGKKVEELDALVSALKTVIVVTLEKTVEFRVKHGTRECVPPIPYGKFAKVLKALQDDAKPKQSPAILTFNYDVAVDFALKHEGVDFEYGLDGDTPSSRLPLLKLHGSLNWTEYGQSPSERRIITCPVDSHWHFISSIPNAQPDKATMDLRGLLFEMFKQQKSVTGESVIVPPTWNKSDSHRALARVWQKAAAVLSEAENIFVIGYSMPETDSFFRHLYALGSVGPTMLKRFWVFDVDGSGTVETRFRRLLGPSAESRFRYVQKPFAEAIPELIKEFNLPV